MSLIEHLGISVLPKLGLAGYKYDERKIQLSSFVSTDFKFRESTERHSAVQNWGMMLNDQLGCCEIATSGHAVQLWTANISKQVTIDDSVIQSVYSRISGYDPNTGANDNGCYENDVDRYLFSTGIDGHKIQGYANVDISKIDLIKYSIYIFGCVRLTAELPLALQHEGAYWQDPKGNTSGIYKKGSWGGHSFLAVDYDMSYLYIVSWGKVCKVDWGWWLTYGMEAVPTISDDWMKANESPQHLDLHGLLTAIENVSKA